MGDAIVQCDGCGAMARRRAGDACPDHWFYLESEDRTPGGPPSVYIVWACSESCRDKLWRRGPAGPTRADLSPERKRPRKPGRGGVGGERIAELETALRDSVNIAEALLNERMTLETDAADIARCRAVLDGTGGATQEAGRG